MLTKLPLKTNSILLVALTAVAAVAIAQSPAFEVASVKPNHSGDDNYGVRIVPGGTLRAVNAPLEAVIAEAYQVPPFELADVPAWAKSERWDIDAKGPGVAAPPEVLRMLQTLLATRFALRVHTETRELPVQALVVAKNGPKLHASSAECFDPTAGIPPPTPTARPCGGFNRMPDQMLGARITMPNLAKTLSKIVGRTVIDRTALDGSYDITLTWRPDDLQSQPDSVPAPNHDATIFTAIQEQLGLRLESQRGPVNILVIDSVERASEN
jgi:uncharacterized protein (TIGR03435 family)